jgi:hypothetical protein
MDLLAGYGSDDSDQGGAHPLGRDAAPTIYASMAAGLNGGASTSRPPVQAAAIQPAAAGLFAKLPAPSSGGGGGFTDAGLSAAGFGLAPASTAKPPQNKPKAQKVVKLHTMKPLAAENSDEVQSYSPASVLRQCCTDSSRAWEPHQ